MIALLWPLLFVLLAFAAVATGISKEYGRAKRFGLAAIPFLILTILFPAAWGNSEVASAPATDAPTARNNDVPTEAPPVDMNFKTISSITKTGDNQYQPCPTTKEKYDAMTAALVQSDNQGYVDATSDAVLLVPGTKVRILDHAGMLGTTLKLRLLSGEDQGKSCWTAGDQSGLFVEGYP